MLKITHKSYIINNQYVATVDYFLLTQYKAVNEKAILALKY